PVDVAAGFFYQTFDLGDIVKTNSLHLNVTGSKLLNKYVEPYVGSRVQLRHRGRRGNHHRRL
ncbi:hypothetical protein ACFL6M_07350, partial [Candidatus Eisenbacteria bacterium]